MSRYIRTRFEGATYHIYERGNNKQDIFLDDEDRLQFLNILKKHKEKFGFQLFAYVLMTNHIHLLINTPDNNISQIMHGININYVKYFNKKHNRVNHLFHDRYKSKIVDRDEYIIILSKYIHNNPVRSNMVNLPFDYAWSSITFFTKEVLDDDLINYNMILSHFSDNIKCAKERYQKFMQTNNDEKYYPDIYNYVGAKEKVVI